MWEVRDVPHGVVAIHTFLSKSLGTPRTVHVYVPPDYDQHPEARFPVLYLLHGSGDMDDGWTVVGRANLIADNLLAEGKMKSALIVMPDGTYPRKPGHEGDFETDLIQPAPARADKLRQSSSRPAYSHVPHAAADAHRAWPARRSTL